MIRAVCFDLDGTLLRDDHSDAVVRRVARLLAGAFPIADADELADANEVAWREHWPEAGEDWLAGRIAPDAVPREVWRRALAAVGVADPAAVDEALALHVRFETEAFELYPEAMGVIEELRSRGIRIAVITNGPSVLQRAKLREVGLADTFDAVVVSGEHGVEKPEDEIFRIALALLGVDADEALHVGDNQIADVAGARRAGLRAVWIDRRGEEQDEEADAVVTDLRGVLALTSSP